MIEERQTSNPRIIIITSLSERREYQDKSVASNVQHGLYMHIRHAARGGEDVEVAEVITNLPGLASHGALAAVNPGPQKPWGHMVPSATAEPASQLDPVAQEHGLLSLCSPVQKDPTGQATPELTNEPSGQ
jgi:hypothetical protein